MTPPALLNVGCGRRFHPAWTNIDLVGRPPHIRAWDINRGLPFPDCSFEAVYHSHVLEHLNKKQGTYLLQECFRVLKPGGVLRIAIPDLERVARNYLQKLDQASSGDRLAESDYEWTVIQLIDQMVREKSGGEMHAYLSHQHIPNRTFIWEQIGEEARKTMAPKDLQRPSLKDTLYKLQKSLPQQILHTWVSLVLGKRNAKAWKLGKFAMSGELHKWMYDRFSLARMMTVAGGENIRRVMAHESSIPEWKSYALDMLLDGTIIKPDSLYMEGQKKASS